MKNEDTRAKGRHGEDIAVDYLRNKGYRIIERNYRNYYGEVDIIADDKGTIVFVEVKSIHGSSNASPAEAVDARKQERLGRVAAAYVARNNYTERMIRFDVVTVSGNKTEVIKDAFDLQEYYTW